MPNYRSRLSIVKRRSPPLQDYLKERTPQGEVVNDYPSMFSLFHLSDIKTSKVYLSKKIHTSFKSDFKLLSNEQMTVTISFPVSEKVHKVSKTYDSFTVQNGDARQILDNFSKKAINAINSAYEKGLVRFSEIPITDEFKEKEKTKPRKVVPVKQCLTCELAIFGKTIHGNKKRTGTCNSDSYEAHVYHPLMSEGYFKRKASKQIKEHCPCWVNRDE